MATRRFILALLPAIALWGAGPAAAVDAGKLVIQITGVRSSDGFVRVAVYDARDQFPGGRTVAGLDARAHQGTTVVDLGDLPAGQYAFAFYHDEDGDGQFGRNFVGLPTEGFGFSNDALVVLGPPSFDDAAFAVAGEVTLSATMRY